MGIINAGLLKRNRNSRPATLALCLRRCGGPRRITATTLYHDRPGSVKVLTIGTRAKENPAACGNGGAREGRSPFEREGNQPV